MVISAKHRVCGFFSNNTTGVMLIAFCVRGMALTLLWG